MGNYLTKAVGKFRDEIRMWEGVPKVSVTNNKLEDNCFGRVEGYFFRSTQSKTYFGLFRIHTWNSQMPKFFPDHCFALSTEDLSSKSKMTVKSCWEPPCLVSRAVTLPTGEKAPQLGDLGTISH